MPQVNRLPTLTHLYNSKGQRDFKDTEAGL
jgi:hypothetical protein